MRLAFNRLPPNLRDRDRLPLLIDIDPSPLPPTATLGAPAAVEIFENSADGAISTTLAVTLDRAPGIGGTGNTAVAMLSISPAPDGDADYAVSGAGVTPGNASGGVLPVTVDFGATDVRRELLITTSTDTDRDDEALTITLTDCTDCVVGSPSEQTLTITEANPRTLGFSTAGPVTAIAGQEFTATVVFEPPLTEAPNGSFPVFVRGSSGNFLPVSSTTYEPIAPVTCVSGFICGFDAASAAAAFANDPAQFEFTFRFADDLIGETVSLEVGGTSLAPNVRSRVIVPRSLTINFVATPAARLGALAAVEIFESSDDGAVSTTLEVSLERAPGTGNSAVATLSISPAPDGDADYAISGAGVTPGTASGGALPVTVDFGASDVRRELLITATADTDSDNEALTITLTDCTGCTVGSFSTQTLTITDASALPANRAPPAPTLTDQRATVGQSFTYTFDAVTDPDGDTVAYEAELEGGSALPGWLTFNTDARTFSGTPGADDVATLTIEVTATDDGTPQESASATFRITIIAAGDNRIARLNEIILPKVAAALADTTNTLVAGRVGQIGQAQGQAQGQAGTGAGGGGDTAESLSLAQWMDGHGQELKQTLETFSEGGSFKPQLDDLSFSMGGGSGGGLGISGMTVWGEGSYQRLSSDSDGIDWDGDLYGGHIGADVEVGTSALAGVALSWFKGEFDYDDGNQSAVALADRSIGADGVYEMSLRSLHPYLGWKISDRLQVWVNLGYGEGDIEITDDAANRRSSDISVQSASSGTRAELFSRGDLANGRNALHLRGDVSLSYLRVDENEADDIREQKLNSKRLRLLLEASHRRAWATNQMAMALELGLRHDGGDGETGQGMEIGGDLEWTDTALGVSLNLRPRGVLLHSSDYGEWGVSGGLSLTPPNHRGLQLSLEPSYGESPSEVSQLWEQGVTELDGPSQRARMHFNGELGYGMWSNGGLLTPYMGFSLASGGGSSLYQLGLRYEVGEQMNISLEGTRKGGDSTAEHGVGMELRLGW